MRGDGHFGNGILIPIEFRTLILLLSQRMEPILPTKYYQQLKTAILRVVFITQCNVYPEKVLLNEFATSDFHMIEITLIIL